MEKEFIPYEQALDLKELGFDEPCFGFFVKSDKINMFQECKWEERTNNEFIKDFLNSKYCSTAPTFSQAFKWFRENFNLRQQYGVFPHHTIITNYLIDGGKEEKAELECLKKLIEIVKDK